MIHIINLTFFLQGIINLTLLKLIKYDIEEIAYDKSDIWREMDKYENDSLHGGTKQLSLSCDQTEYGPKV